MKYVNILIMSLCMTTALFGSYRDRQAAADADTRKLQAEREVLSELKRLSPAQVSAFEQTQTLKKAEIAAKAATEQAAWQAQSEAHRANTERYKMEQQHLQIETERTRGREARETSRYSDELARNRQQEADQLARKRDTETVAQQKKMHFDVQDRQRKTEEEVAAVRLKAAREEEEQKRKTAEKQAELDRVTQQQAIAAKGEEDRKNIPVQAEEDRKSLPLKSEQERLTLAARGAQDRLTLDARWKNIMSAMSMTGNGVMALLNDKPRLVKLVVTICALVGGIYALKEVIRVLSNYFEALLGKPSLVLDSSRLSVKKIIKKALFDRTHKPATLDDIILPKKVADIVPGLITSISNSATNDDFMRNYLFWGPPGTGKTLLATIIAQSAGIDYAIISGASFEQFKEGEAIVELTKLFDWLEMSKKKCILFIDEADAFLSSRNSPNVTERHRKILNAFLQRTGTESKKYSIIFATNYPSILDSAILDRIDEKIEFTKPDFENRVKMLKMYFKKHCASLESSPTVDTKATWNSVATQFDGFSGREISKFVIGLKAEAMAKKPAYVSQTLLEHVVNRKLEQHASFAQIAPAVA